MINNIKYNVKTNWDAWGEFYNYVHISHGFG
jgi:hypothetical protein